MPVIRGFAQESIQQPHGVPFPPPIESPQDKPFPGKIRLEVDATDLAHRVFRVKETIPVTGGTKMTLLFPQWTTGDHTPNGPLDQMAGLIITSGSQRVHWVRDTVQVFAFHVDVPAGEHELDLQYQYLGSTDWSIGPMLITTTMLDVQWQTVVLYPAGFYSRDIKYEPSVLLPHGWSFASALDGAQKVGDTVTFAPVDLETLIDSPMMGAHYLKQIALTNKPVPVRLDVAATSEAGLDGTGPAVQDLSNMVAQAYQLFGSHHYNHYEFMLWLSADMGPLYYEHHRSGENSNGPSYLKKWNTEAYKPQMVHGYIHSWNGTFRRPVEMWTPNFNTPERDSMLWVFEGLTMYWEDLLCARASFSSHKEYVDYFANLAAQTSIDVGQEWRPLEDVNNGPIIWFRKPQSWATWQRNFFDAYSGGEMIWLDADTLIRKLTSNRKSLDDFARSFYGMHDGSYITQTYTFDNMVGALNAIAPYDWTTFFRSQLDEYSPGGRIDGLARGGYKLIYGAEPITAETEDSLINLRDSVGMLLTPKGKIQAVHWGGAAWKAGLIPGLTIVSVNRTDFSPDVIRAAVKATASGAPLVLTAQVGGAPQSFTIEWKGGLRYAHAERIPDAPAFLDDILRAR